jgi:hypothetical protein
VVVRFVGLPHPLKHQVTVETPLRKFEPFTVRVVLPLPAIAPVGEMLVTAGVGTVIAKVWLRVDTALPPFVTRIVAEPRPVIKLAGTVAVSVVALTKVVARLVLLPPQELHQSTVE